MTLNSKYKTEKLKAENKRYRNTKNQNPEKLKPSFSKRIGRKWRFIYQPVMNKIMTTRK